jgi:hypothetical protein
LTRCSKHSLILSLSHLYRFVAVHIGTSTHPIKSIISFPMRYLTNRTMLGESKHPALFRYVSIRANCATLPVDKLHQIEQTITTEMARNSIRGLSSW